MMDYFEKFLTAYQETQLKDADDLIKFSSSKMQSYTDKIMDVINGSHKKDGPFIIASLETIAKGLRQNDEKASKVADSLEKVFNAIMVEK